MYLTRCARLLVLPDLFFSIYKSIAPIILIFKYIHFFKKHKKRKFQTILCQSAKLCSWAQFVVALFALARAMTAPMTRLARRRPTIYETEQKYLHFISLTSEIAVESTVNAEQRRLWTHRLGAPIMKIDEHQSCPV